MSIDPRPLMLVGLPSAAVMDPSRLCAYVRVTNGGKNSTRRPRRSRVSSLRRAGASSVEMEAPTCRCRLAAASAACCACNAFKRSRISANSVPSPGAEVSCPCSPARPSCTAPEGSSGTPS